jgi:hypothetical protein
MTVDHKKNMPPVVSLEREVSLGIIQKLTIAVVSSFGESLRWVPHHPSGGSHLSKNIIIMV